MEDVASGAHAAIVKRDWDALQPLLDPYLHWVQYAAVLVRRLAERDQSCVHLG
jgi:tryptophan-rich sensory protein